MKPTNAQLQGASRLGLVMSHPLRIEILCLTAEWKGASASLIGTELNLPVANVAFHVNVLVKTKCLRHFNEKRKRGAVEHIFKISPLGRSILDLVVNLDASGRVLLTSKLGAQNS
jgi:predicted ArsR family transcriptional regulator